ncbi:hypothetical protein CLOP_g9120 [Closterium sp. NIES-67]|nr:hypothetical protein CLOP_g9120 [Closterium sp. NIES-67]
METSSSSVRKRGGDWESLGVDIVVEDPDGYHVHSAQGQTEGVFSFESMREGDYKVCFTNKSPVNEEIVFDLHVGHHFTEKELAKEEHVEQNEGQGKEPVRAGDAAVAAIQIPTQSGRAA